MAQGPARELGKIAAYIVTHREISVADIGSLAPIVPRIYDELYPVVDGLVVLYTCNRLEVYLDSDPESLSEAVARLEKLLAGTPAAGKARVLRGVEAVRHLYRVACGLESVMLGENEVLGQVRDAWLEAKENNYTTRLLDMVFHGAIVAGRRARRETGISRGAIGYPEAAVELASRKLGSLDEARILVVGAGQAARAMASSLCSKYSPRELVIANRSREKAALLASTLTGCGAALRAVGLDEASGLRGFDAVFIAVSGSPGLDWATSSGRIVVDISNPPVVSGENVYTMDDVAQLVEKNLEARMREVPRVEEIIEAEIARLLRYIAEKRAEEVISLIMKTARNIARREAEEARRVLAREPVDGVLERAFWSYSKKLLHPLLVGLREMAARGHLEALELIEQYYRDRVGTRRRRSPIPVPETR